MMLTETQILNLIEVWRIVPYSSSSSSENDNETLEVGPLNKNKSRKRTRNALLHKQTVVKHARNSGQRYISKKASDLCCSMDPEECQRIQRLLHEVEDASESAASSTNEDSEGDKVELSNHLSESEQFGDEEPVVVNNDDPTYTGKDNLTKWRKHALPRNVITQQQNIMTHLPGERAAGKNSKTSKERFSLFINGDIIEKMVVYTNIKIE
ncbi:hypothetical protein J6590_082466 [Homalodisca vitripennis]|nr:hypothetical protein J6590_082466 [Homalodisca vitripennis]